MLMADSLETKTIRPAILPRRRPRSPGRRRREATRARRVRSRACRVAASATHLDRGGPAPRANGATDRQTRGERVEAAEERLRLLPQRLVEARECAGDHLCDADHEEDLFRDVAPFESAERGRARADDRGESSLR